MLPAEARDLLRHMEWADELVWTALSDAAGARLDPEDLERLHHLHSVQWAYLQIWRDEPIRIPEAGSFQDADALRRWARAGYDELRSWLDGLKDTDLTRPVEFPWAGEVAARFGSAGPVNLAESLLQVALHSTHHRGQIATRIRALGAEPPLVDYVAWLWMQRPSPPNRTSE